MSSLRSPFYTALAGLEIACQIIEYVLNAFRRSDPSSCALDADVSSLSSLKCKNIDENVPKSSVGRRQHGVTAKPSVNLATSHTFKISSNTLPSIGAKLSKVSQTHLQSTTASPTTQLPTPAASLYSQLAEIYSRRQRHLVDLIARYQA